MNQRLPYYGLFPLVAFIVMRQALGGQPVFRSEFVAEDFILLLAVAFGLAPPRFRRLIWRVITCSISVVMALVAWTIGVHKFPLPRAIVSTAVFALLASYSAVLGVNEFSKLRKERLNNVPPQ